MKILALSDWPPAPGLYERIINNHIDLVITCGDLGLFDLQDLKKVTHIPKIGVYGNHCTRGYMEELGIIDLHLNTISINGLTFGGFEGCVRYKDSQYAPMWTQDEAFEMMKNFPPVDVFVSHCPPFGINDHGDTAHTGFKALLNYLTTKQPKTWFHGHTYPVDLTIVKEYDGTLIHYTDPEIIVEI
jgi:uncharacterized protein